MQDLRKTILDVFSSEVKSVFVSNTVDWVEKPVSFRVFVESDEHMNFPPLSERQYEVADFMLGGDVEQIFDNKNTLAVLLYGKGAGKDTISCLIILYIVHWLLCLRSPQKFFGLPEGEAIDLLNVAASADQASTVFFDKLRQRVIRWKWLKDRWPFKVSGVFLGQIKPEDFLNTVVITKNGVLFPKNIRAFSGHSLESSQEGLNLLCFTLDECSAFDDTPSTNRAQKIFDMLKSSAVSRFGERWKGFAISFPRYRGDFTMRLLDIAEGELHWYSDRGATWEIKPARCFKDYPEKYFEFEGYKIPLEYETEFRLNPTDAKGKYCTEPPEIEQAFVEYPEKVDLCVDYSRPPIAVLDDYIEGNEVKKRVLYFNTDSVPREYIVTIDLGLRNDSAALSIFHKEQKPSNDVFVQDLVTVWVPDKEKDIIVSLINIEEVIRTLKKHINIIGVWFDQWNSQLLVQRLNQSGLFSEVYRLEFQDYKNFKDRLYLGEVRLLNFPRQLMEIKRLILLKGGKVDHPIDSSKDIVDTIVGALKILTGEKRSTSTIPSPIGGEIIVSDNLFSQGGSFL